MGELFRAVRSFLIKFIFSSFARHLFGKSFAQNSESRRSSTNPINVSSPIGFIASEDGSTCLGESDDVQNFDPNFTITATNDPQSAIRLDYYLFIGDCPSSDIGLLGGNLEFEVDEVLGNSINFSIDWSESWLGQEGTVAHSLSYDSSSRILTVEFSKSECIPQCGNGLLFSLFLENIPPMESYLETIGGGNGIVLIDNL